MYRFKNFWVPFIIMFAIILGVIMLAGDTGPAFGVLLIGIFYFYNRGYKNGKKDDA